MVLYLIGNKAMSFMLFDFLNKCSVIMVLTIGLNLILILKNLEVNEKLGSLIDIDLYALIDFYCLYKASLQIISTMIFYIPEPKFISGFTYPLNRATNYINL